MDGEMSEEEHRDTDPAEALRCSVLTRMLALLRAQRWNYQTTHWQSQGGSSYGDHLLFQRLYEDRDEEIDSLAEKIVGLFGVDSDGEYHFDNLSQAEMTESWLQSWSVFECPFHRALQSEKDFQSFWAEGYKVLKDLGDMSLGLDDWLMSTASEHETNQYLLQQRVSQQHQARQASQKLTRVWFSSPSSQRRGRETREASDTESD